MFFEKIRTLAAEKFEISEEKITMDTDIFEDLGADSLDIVDMLMMIEEQFEVSIPDEAAQDMKTIGDVVSYLEENSK